MNYVQKIAETETAPAPGVPSPEDPSAPAPKRFDPPSPFDVRPLHATDNNSSVVFGSVYWTVIELYI